MRGINLHEVKSISNNEENGMKFVIGLVSLNLCYAFVTVEREPLKNSQALSSSLHIT